MSVHSYGTDENECNDEAKTKGDCKQPQNTCSYMHNVNVIHPKFGIHELTNLKTQMHSGINMEAEKCQHFVKAPMPGSIFLQCRNCTTFDKFNKVFRKDKQADEEESGVNTFFIDLWSNMPGGQTNLWLQPTAPVGKRKEKWKNLKGSSWMFMRDQSVESITNTGTHSAMSQHAWLLQPCTLIL